MGIIFLVVLVTAIYFLIQVLRMRNVIGQVPETPLDILKKRYAKGEIQKEEFERLKKDLQL